MVDRTAFPEHLNQGGDMATRTITIGRRRINLKRLGVNILLAAGLYVMFGSVLLGVNTLEGSWNPINGFLELWELLLAIGFFSLLLIAASTAWLYYSHRREFTGLKLAGAIFGTLAMLFVFVHFELWLYLWPLSWNLLASLSLIGLIVFTGARFRGSYL